MDNKETFNYTYSAKERKEIEEIRKKYVEPLNRENKIEQLRRLDAGVTAKAQAVSLALGIIGALILGLGMSLAMTELGESFGLNGEISLILGIIIGVVGIVPVCAAYPVYNRIVKKQREKIAPEIIRLTDELMK